MGRLTCNCLNVKIHTKSDDLTPTTAGKIGLDSEACDQFFNKGISEVFLHLEGVCVEHRCLVKDRPCCGWLVHKCINCGLYTHAVNTQNNRVIVNTSLKSDATSIDSLSHSEDYSPLYKVVLSSRIDNQPVRSIGVQSGKYESLQQVLTSIQQQLNQFLVSEESAMENRIREYQEAQRQAYAELQSKVRRHKNTMINVILAAEQSDISESLTDAMTEGGNRTQQDNGDEAPSQPTVTRRAPAARLTRMESISKRKSGPLDEDQVTPPRLGGHRRGPPSPEEVDGVFDFDPAFQDDNNQPFYNSDDDNEDTDDSSVNGDSEPVVVRGGLGSTKNQHSMFSTSVPISMPAWGGPASRARMPSRQIQQGRTSLDEDDNDDFAPAPHPEDMAASIKALARSVHGDTTEIFGDLPTRRTRAKITTSDMLHK